MSWPADPWLASARREEARERLEEFVTGDLTRYLRAVDSTLYAAAAGAAQTRLLVRGLRAQHDLLAAGIERLERIDDAEAFAATAQALVGLLHGCLHLEREVLAPALTDLAGLDLAGLVADLNTLLAGGMVAAPELVDVRAIPRGQRHPRIFTGFCRLGPGESLVLINDHDPQHLGHEFEATSPGDYRWDYLETGPREHARLSAVAGICPGDPHSIDPKPRTSREHAQPRGPVASDQGERPAARVVGNLGPALARPAEAGQGVV